CTARAQPVRLRDLPRELAMGIILGANQYGKAEIRVVSMDRDTPRHEIHDLSVTTTLQGDFAAAHESGDQSNVLPTDSQKNTVFAFAKERGVDQIEDFALDLARWKRSRSSRGRSATPRSRTTSSRRCWTCRRCGWPSWSTRIRTHPTGCAGPGNRRQSPPPRRSWPPSAPAPDVR